MKVAEVMRRQVVTARPETNISDAAGQMVHGRFSGMPVVDEDGGVIGVVTEGDLLRRAEVGTERRRPHWIEVLMGPKHLADEFVKSHASKVGDVMTSDPVVIDADALLESAVDLMERHGVKRLPVVRDGKLAGILSRADVLAAYVYRARAAGNEGVGDGEIRKAILDAFQKQNWLRGDNLSVVVRDGEVELDGIIMSENERKALVIMVEGVKGVTKVVDKLVYVDPITLAPIM